MRDTLFIDPRQLDWNWLRVFVVVAEHGAMSRAAAALGLSQPTLSRQIAELEAHVGRPLFERVARGLALTAAGHALLEPATRMLAAAQAVSLAAAGQNQSLAGTVRITASEVMSAYVLPPLLAQLAQIEPEIQIELVASNRVDNLLAREADIAIRMVRPAQSALIARKVADWPLGFYAHHRLATQIPASLSAADADALAQLRWVGLDQSTQFINGFAQGGIKVTREFFAFRCDNQIVGLEAIRAGVGVGVAMHHLAARFSELAPVLPLLPAPSLPVWLTAHRELRATPRIGRVYDFLAEQLRTLAD